MRPQLYCLIAASAVAGCGGAQDTSTAVGDQVIGVTPNAVTCNTPAAYTPVNQSVTRLQGGKKFTVAVQVQGGTNGLSFEWRSTDGKVEDVNAASTTWTAPEGPGLHFVYVLVKNGKGGYTQRRIAISTEDAAGVPKAEFTPVDYAPPASPEVNCFQFRSFIRTSEVFGTGNSSGNSKGGDAIVLPDVELYASEAVPVDKNNPKAPVLIAKSDSRGSFNIDHVPPGQFDSPTVGNTIVRAKLNLGEDVAIGVDIATGVPEAKNDVFGQPLGVAQSIVGRVLLADRSNCGLVDEFFAKDVTGTAKLLDAAGNVLSTRRLSDRGHYAFPPTAGAAKIRLQCENSTAKEIAVSTSAPLTILTDSSAPKVTGMTAIIQGASANSGIFLTPFSGGQSDKIPDAAVFLAYKGIDNALSTCMYYRSIGAVKECGPKGELIGAITVDDWRRKNGIGDAFVRNDVISRGKAQFINRVDLNLSRQHEGVTYKSGEAAMEVCNYLGAANDLDAAIVNNPALAQTAIDAAVDGMVAKKNLVACVMMDHTATAGVNGGKAFTNFLIFGGSGELLPRINLDGRSEKWVPGTCIICHGSDRYAGRFPTDGTGLPDIGTHLLPFIIPNFNFSSKVGLRRQDQEAEIKKLNLIVAQAGATEATKAQVAGWYANGRATFDDNFIPSSWANRSAIDKSWYQNVYKADCLGCHINGPDRLNFDKYENLVQSDRSQLTALNISACGGGNVPTSTAFIRNLSMPNALRTFDLVWGSAGTSVDKVDLMARFIGQYLTDVTKCNLVQTPIGG